MQDAVITVSAVKSVYRITRVSLLGLGILMVLHDHLVFHG